jgi:outer membrane protein assembly factor BamB
MLTLALGAVPARAVDLTTYGYSNARLGSSPGPVGISPSAAKRLRPVWRNHLSGAIDAEPLIVNHVRLAHRTRDLLVVATEHGVIAALDVHSGKRIWERRLGSHRISPSCQTSPDGIFGFTGTPVIDKAAGRVYAVNDDGRAWALSLSNGKTVRGWPAHAFGRGADFDWGAVALGGGRLYVPIASLCDRGLYFGGIRAIDVARPRRVWKWGTTGGHGYGGGIWGWGGLSIDGRTGDVFAATGNALGGPENAGDAERVVRLSPSLHVKQSDNPLLPPFQISDRDFGTVPLLIREPRCPPQAIAINKNGILYRYNANLINHGASQAIRVSNSTNKTIPLYGMPVFDPGERRLVLESPTVAPGTGLGGGLQSFVLTPHCQLVPSWRRGFDPPNAGGPPTIADGVLYVSGGRNGVLHAYRLSDGDQLYVRGFGRTMFSAPAVADGTVVVGDWRGGVVALRPRRGPR